MSEIRTVVVHSSEDVRNRRSAASSVKTYDKSLCEIFPFFINGDPGLIGEFCDTLSNGYTQDEYGPFWPSFASMNDGRDGKVLWVSQAGLGCLLTMHQNGYNFDLQEGQ